VVTHLRSRKVRLFLPFIFLTIFLLTRILSAAPRSISNALKKAAASAPGSPNLEPNKRPKTSTSSSSSSSDAFWAQTPGFEQIWHGKSAAKGPSASNAALGVALDLASYAKHLEPFRVSLNSLSKKEQYQVRAETGSTSLVGKKR
jgi:hypothetical protein